MRARGRQIRNNKFLNQKTTTSGLVRVHALPAPRPGSVRAHFLYSDRTCQLIERENGVPMQLEGRSIQEEVENSNMG